MGNIVKTTRSVLRSVDDLRTFVTEYDYDSFGKMKTLTYPDKQDKDIRTIGYKGVACIMDNNGSITSRYDVTCGVDASGKPNQQWETLNYTQNKDNDQR